MYLSIKQQHAAPAMTASGCSSISERMSSIASRARFLKRSAGFGTAHHGPTAKNSPM